VPYTTLTFSSTQESFRLNEARIVYSGPPLPPPSPEQMQAAQAAMFERAHATAQSAEKNESHGAPTAETVSLLRARVRSQPGNAEAHLDLAQALRRSCQINGAIVEYRAALNLSVDDKDVHDKALKALQSLRVIQSDGDSDPNRRQDLELYNHGQRLRAHGWQKQQQGKQQSGVAGSPPGSLPNGQSGTVPYGQPGFASMNATGVPASPGLNNMPNAGSQPGQTQNPPNTNQADDPF
jgi:hypothetical protein